MHNYIFLTSAVSELLVINYCSLLNNRGFEKMLPNLKLVNAFDYRRNVTHNYGQIIDFIALDIDLVKGMNVVTNAVE